MVLIHEFRVPLHMTVDEFQVAQLYMVVDASEKMTGDGEGVEILKNEPYDNTDGSMGVSAISGWTVPRNKGQYTLKHYYCKSKIPGFVAAFCPEDSMVLVEEAWNAYPHCVTVITNGYLAKNKFYICIESNHLADSGETENALKMSNNELNNRKIEYLDIAETLPKQTLKEDCDPATYKSVKTSRGPLQKGWQKKVDPIMTCYKAVKINFEYWGVQGKAEKIIRDQQRQLFHNTLRQAQCLTDDWFGLTMDDIRRLEENVVAKLEAKRQQVTGNQQLGALDELNREKDEELESAMAHEQEPQQPPPQQQTLASVLVPAVKERAFEMLPSPSGPGSSSSPSDRVADPRRTQSANALHTESQQERQPSPTSTSTSMQDKGPAMLAVMGRSSSNFLALSSNFFMGATSSLKDEKVATVPVNIVYKEPGPLFVDLFSRPDGKGAYVKAFRRKADGAMGGAEASGQIRVNDELFAINGVVVTDMLFTSIIQAAKGATFPLALTFHCRVVVEPRRNSLLPPASPAKGSTNANNSINAWTAKLGQMMAETGMKRSSSFEKKLDQNGANGNGSSSGGATSPANSGASSSNGGGGETPTGQTTPGKLKQSWGDSITLDKMKNSDGMKNLLRMIGGKAKPEEDRETVNMWLDQLMLRPDIAHADQEGNPGTPVNSLYHSTPIVTVTAGGRLIAVKEEDASEFVVSWYRKTRENDLIHIKGAKSGRYFPSVDDVGTKISAQVQSLRFAQLARVVEFPRVLQIDPAVGELVDILLEAGAGSFSATLASNEYDSFQVKISSERVSLVKISEDDDEAGVIVNGPYDPHLQVLLDPTDQLRFTLKVKEFGSFLGNRRGDTCSMKKRKKQNNDGRQFADFSCFFLVAQNPQHRDILALLIRKFRAQVLSSEQEDQAHRDEINLFMDPAFACSSLSVKGRSAQTLNAGHSTASPHGSDKYNSSPSLSGAAAHNGAMLPTRNSFTLPPNQQSLDATRGQRSASDVTQSVGARIIDLFGLDQDEDAGVSASSPYIREHAGTRLAGSSSSSSPSSDAFLQSRMASQEKEIAMLQEKLSSLSVLLKSIDHEKKQIQASFEVKDKRIELQQLKIKQLEKLTAHYNSQSRELQTLRAKLEDEERLRAATQQQLEEMVARSESTLEKREQESQTDDQYKQQHNKDNSSNEGWVGEDIASQLSPRSINFEVDYLTSTIEKLQQQVSNQQQELTKLQDQQLVIVSERNAFRSKTHELGKELRKLVNANRSLADIESQLAERSELAMQLSIAKAEAKRATDESKEFKDALECVMKQRGMGDKDKDTQRVLSQNLDLQRVVHQLTDSLNESKDQMTAMKSINSALMEKLQHLQPDARGSILFESPMNSPSSVASARVNPTFSSDEEDDSEDDDDSDEDEGVSGISGGVASRSL